MLGFLKRLLPASGDKCLRKYLREQLGAAPRDIAYYKAALIHRSVSVSPTKVGCNNERLEYLGDAIISAAVAQYLFAKYPDKNEGFLSQLRSKLVSRNTLNAIATAIGIEKHIQVRQGIDIAAHKNLLGNSVEALVGALFLDRGYSYAKNIFINRLLLQHIDLPRIEVEAVDCKSRLIEWSQKHKQPVLFLSEEEPSNDQARKRFKAVVELNGDLIREGYGFSKKEAEQDAARKLWDHIQAVEC